MKIILLLMISLWSCGAFGQSTAPSSIFEAEPFPSTSVMLSLSWVKDREALNTAYIKSLDPERLLHNFRINAGLPSHAKPLEGWEDPKCGLRGHFVGHYLTAISLLVERYHDALLSRRLIYMVTELGKCQQLLGKGYLSAFPATEFDKLETKFTGVWAPYYTYHKIMQGLLDAYTHTGNRRALEIVEGMADYVSFRMSRLDDKTIEKVLYTVAANPANEAGGMNEVLYNLYRVTANPRDLALAKIFDRNWFADPLSENHDILSGLHSNTHLVLVNGFAQRYSITGETKYHDAVVNFWNILQNSHTYVNGTSSGPRPNVTTPTSIFGEHWGDPAHLSNTMTKGNAESCVTHNTQKLTATLFSWTADSKYAEAYMNTFYNAVMALQNEENGACVYFLPLGSPQVKAFLKEDDFRCCNGTTIDAFAALNANIYFHHGETLWINLYIPSTVTWNEKGFKLSQHSGFPVDSNVFFDINMKQPAELPLKLFVPSWATSAKVYINGQKQSLQITASSYVTLKRRWHDNDHIRLTFNYGFRVQTMPDDPKMIAIFYGPTLLAFETTEELALKGSLADILRNLSITAKDTYQLKNAGVSYALRPFYQVKSESYGIYAAIKEY